MAVTRTEIIARVYHALGMSEQDRWPSPDIEFRISAACKRLAEMAKAEDWRYDLEKTLALTFTAGVATITDQTVLLETLREVRVAGTSEPLSRYPDFTAMQQGYIGAIGRYTLEGSTLRTRTRTALASPVAGTCRVVFIPVVGAASVDTTLPDRLVEDLVILLRDELRGSVPDGK